MNLCPGGWRLFSNASACIIQEHQPDNVAIEDVFYALNVKSALKLGQVRGVAMLAASSAGLEVTEYSPLSIKSAVVGYGRAEKPQVQHMVTRLLNLSRDTGTARCGRRSGHCHLPSSYFSHARPPARCGQVSRAAGTASVIFWHNLFYMASGKIIHAFWSRGSRVLLASVAVSALGAGDGSRDFYPGFPRIGALALHHFRFV